MSKGSNYKLTVAGLLLICLLGSGCSRGIKEGLYAIKGSSGKASLIKGETSRLAEEYGSFRVEPFQNDVGDICPEEFLAELGPAIEESLQYKSKSFKDSLKGKKKEELGPFFAGPTEKILVIKGVVIQYDMGSLMDKAASPMDEAICRIRIYDGGDDSLLAEANCTGRSKSSVRTGPKELAEGVAKGIKKLLKVEK